MPRTIQNGKGADGKAGDASGERLSPGTENYLLCLYKLWEDSTFPTTTQLTDTLKQLPLTEGLGTSVPSVAGMVRRMQRQGLVEIGKDKRIRLTEKGAEGGADIARRHRLAEWLVVRLLGMDLYKAHVEAHRLEHGMSQEFQEKLMERLGYPDRSPFGRPIPGTGAPVLLPNSLTLDDASANVTYLVDRVPEEDVMLLKFLADSLILPGHEISVDEATPYLGVIMVASGGNRIPIGYNVAHQILVRPGGDQAPGSSNRQDLLN